MAKHGFITYTHPDQRLQASNRRQVAQFVATNHRNRSAPSTRYSTSSEKQIKARRLQPGSKKYGKGCEETAIFRDGSGLHQDPFLVLPTTDSAGVSLAIDYYINSYGPAHIIQPGLISVKDRGKLVVQQLRDAVQQPVMFESLLALTFANLALMSTPARNVEKLALVHYSRAISSLRSSITSNHIEDAVLISIISIIGTNYLQGDLSAFQVNLRGLRKVIMLRGGLGAIGKDSRVISSVMTIESFWTYLRSQAESTTSALLPAITVNQVTIDNSESVSLAQRIPLGFQSLFNEGRLSLDVAIVISRHVEAGNSWTYSPPTSHIHGKSIRKFADVRTINREVLTIGSHIQTCEDLARLLANPDLTHLDIVCCTGMFINALCVARSEQLSPIYDKQLQHHAKQLLECKLDSEDPEARDLHAWAIIQVASTMFPTRTTKHFDIEGDLRLRLAVKLVAAYSGYSWDDMKKLFREFICSETCLNTFENVWEVGRKYID